MTLNKLSQLEMQEFKEPILADIRNLQREKAELEEVRMCAYFQFISLLCLCC